MPLPTPILDDRSYQQLRDELIRRIPVYNPEWTDHNATDPGITLIELFAFLGENLLYRFNQIPETTKLAFLRLLDVPLRPASAARAMVALGWAKPDLAVDTAPPVVKLGTTVKAGAIPFETLTEVSVAPFDAVVVARSKVDAPTTPEGVEFAVTALDARGDLEDGEVAVFYESTLIAKDPSKPDALPVDFGKTVDGMIWIAALGKDLATNADRVHLLADRTINVGFVPDETITSVKEASDPCPGEGEAAKRADRCRPADTAGGAGAAEEVVWEISTGEIDAKGEPVYEKLDVRGDTTRGMRQRGVVRLAIPHETTRIGVFPLADPDLGGTGMRPPVLADAKEDARVAFWIRGYHRQGEHRFGRALWIGLNAADVIQKKKAATETLGVGTGQAAQIVRLVHRPVIKGSLAIEIEEQPGRWMRWTEVAGFEASREDDRHFTVDLASGEVRFGNGVSGLAPQIGQRIRAAEYRYGGGVAGNVPAKALSKLEVDGKDDPRLATVTVANPLAARGGAEAEPIAAALERIPAELRRHDRAVTAGDFRELALATPGADVGRAECLPTFDPTTLSTESAGTVTVVVFPREDPKRPNAPMPDKTTLGLVCAYLDARRLVTTRLFVIPPEYVKVAVSIGNLHVKPGYGNDAVRSWIELVVRQYLAPLPPYGPDGGGWPLGRPVYAPEIEAVALQVEGVEYIDGGGVSVAWLDSKGEWREEKVLLLPHQVPELASITVVTGKPIAVGEAYTPPPVASDTGAPATPVPIPTIPEEC